MHFLPIVLHLLQTDAAAAAQRAKDVPADDTRTFRIASPPHGKRAVIALPLLIGASLAPAYAQQFNFSATPGLTDTQSTLASAMDSACNALAATPGADPGQVDLFATCNTLGGADQATLQDDLEILAPDEIATLGTASVNVFNAQIANVVQRLAGVRGSGGVGGTGLASLGFDPGDWMLAATSTDGLAIGNGEDGADDTERLGVFVNGSGGSGDRDATVNEPGFDFDTQAVTAGLDYRVLDNLVLGAAASYTRIDSELNASGGKVDVDGYSVSLFGTYFEGASFYIDGIASIGRNEFDTSRTVVFGDVNQQALSDPSSDEYAVGIGSGYDFNFDQWSMGPFGQFNYVRAEIDAFEEQASTPGALGAGSLLAVDDQTVKSLTTALGGQTSYAISSAVGVFVPQLRVAWVHEYEEDNQTISGEFINDPTDTGFAVPTDDPDRDYFTAALGVSGQFTNNLAAFVQYERLVGHSYLDENVVNGGVRLSF